MSYIDEKNTALLVLAYPILLEKDKLWLDSYRQKHDKLFYGIVEPHFSIVFPTFNIPYSDFILEIETKAKYVNKFNFIFRCAMMNHDKLSEYNHIFLSPDEGNSNIVKMHDIFYSGILSQTQRLDIDFFSHIAIGNEKDINKCKKLVDQLNSENISINGTIDSVDIITFGNSIVENVKKISIIKKSWPSYNTVINAPLLGLAACGARGFGCANAAHPHPYFERLVSAQNIAYDNVN
jgi:hypothetical protein